MTVTLMTETKKKICLDTSQNKICIKCMRINVTKQVKTASEIENAIYNAKNRVYFEIVSI